METESFEIFTMVPASPEDVYAAWLDANTHSQITGKPATGEPAVGSRFTAWDNYIEGTHDALEPGRRILQLWRTTEFGENDPDSVLELLFEPHDEGTRLTLRHSNIPAGQGELYEKGWQEHYFPGLQAWFSGRAVAAPKEPRRAAKPARARRTPKKAGAGRAGHKTAGTRRAARSSSKKRAPKKKAGKATRKRVKRRR